MLFVARKTNVLDFTVYLLFNYYIISVIVSYAG